MSYRCRRLLLPASYRSRSWHRERFAPFFCHWYANGAVPAAVTVNVAICPTVTVRLAGCVLIVGATEGELTVRIAFWLVMVPSELLTITSNVDPLSADVIAGVV